jgi:hypothetical protein
VVAQERKWRQHRLLLAATSAPAEASEVSSIAAQLVPPSASQKAEDYWWAARCKVWHNAWVQVRYHRRRQRFFDLADKVTKSVTVLLGASLLGETTKAKLPLVASAISGLGLLALVFGYGDRKQTHKELAEQCAALLATIENVPASALSAEKVASWSADYLRIVAKAPPPLKTLTLICEREQATADGNPNHVAQPLFLKRWLAHFV